MKVAIAGAGNVGTFIAADLLAAGHEVLLIEKDPALVARQRESSTSAGSSPTPARCPRSSDAGLADVDVWWPPPATTRTTSWSRSWPSRSSRCHASSLG